MAWTSAPTRQGDAWNTGARPVFKILVGRYFKSRGRKPGAKQDLLPAAIHANRAAVLAWASGNKENLFVGKRRSGTDTNKYGRAGAWAHNHQIRRYNAKNVLGNGCYWTRSCKTSQQGVSRYGRCYGDAMG